MSLAEPEERDPYRTVGMLCVLRYERSHSDEQIAKKLGFDGVEDMRVQLENWKLPGWLIGAASGPKGKATQGQDTKRRTGKRKAKSVRGPAQELPPSKEAASLFKEALDKLRNDLERLVYLQSGPRRTPEYLQDGRFIQDTREEAPRWAPDIGGRTRITGVTQTPQNGLTELIAAYLVAGGDPEPLIERLHYNPNALDREKLGRVLYGDKKNSKPGLLTRAVHAARLIRGAGVEGGAQTGEFDVDKMSTRHQILDMRTAGLSDQEIIDVLSSEGTPISMGQLNRLAGLGMPDLTQ